MIMILDNFCAQIDRVRQSALESGFGTWRPPQGEVGSSVYDGMNFWGDHATLVRALMLQLGKPIFPNSMFFRVTLPDTEPAYVHSDREAGQWTCIVYCSQHQERSGTAFYQHRETGLREMPSFDELRQQPDLFAQLKREMVEADPTVWDEWDFVRGAYNRALLFNAPLFHARFPKGGLGTDAETGRIVWVCHFMTDMGS